MNETPLPTPRTDEAAAQYRFHEANPFNLAVVSIDVSKQLERELSAAQDELAIVTDQLEVETHRHREGAESWLEMRRRIEAERDAATAACAAKDAAIIEALQKCGYCDGTGQEHDGEGWLGVPCPKCAYLNAALSNPAGQELLKELHEAKQQAYDWHQQSESAWKNRDVFCKHINIIGHEVLGFQSDNCAPDAVSREAKKLLTTQSARIAELEGALEDMLDDKAVLQGKPRWDACERARKAIAAKGGEPV